MKSLDKKAIESSLRELVRLLAVSFAAVVVSWLTGIQEGLGDASVWTLAVGLLIKAIDRYAYKAKGVNITKI